MATIQPPLAKIYEAYSAVADHRVYMTTDQAIVIASNYQKGYTVRFTENEYSSNDNATYWQHYAGYPIIATLLAQGRLTPTIADLTPFQHVDWHALNEANHRNYDQAIQAMLAPLPAATQTAIKSGVAQTAEDLAALPLTIKRNRAKLVDPATLNQ